VIPNSNTIYSSIYTTSTPPPLPNVSLGRLTVQDHHPYKSPLYNGVNPNYPNLSVLHQNPPMFAVADFLTHTECDFLINVSQDCFSPAPVVVRLVQHSVCSFIIYDSMMVSSHKLNLLL
jgi:hypothetical protein